MKFKLVALLVAFASLACTLSAIPASTQAQANTASSFHVRPSAVPVPAHKATVTASRSVNIRDAANEHSPVTGAYYGGQTVWVVGCKDGWADVIIGWVKAEYLGNICN